MVDDSDIGNEISNRQADAPEVTLEQIWAWLENVCDPEVPVLSVLDLGVVRSISVLENGTEISSAIDDRQIKKPAILHRTSPLTIYITPTYTGCPAINMMAANIRLELLSKGLENVQVIEILSPAWTTDWMSESGKRKLLEYGIAPPLNKARMDKLLFSDIPVPCPRCGSENTERISEFGSTACKSLHRCLDCREPFDYFKCH